MVFAAHRVVGADRQESEWPQAVAGPVAEDLGDEGERRHEHKRALARQSLGPPQSNQGLAGAAGADELPPVVLTEPAHHIFDGFDLVGPQFLGLLLFGEKVIR